jgi:uncharacterized phage protein gp47/JayE
MLYTDQELLTRVIEAYQARCPQLTDYNVGEIMLGLAEGDRDVAADLLYQAERQLNRAMIDGATGDDLETLLAGFGFTRQEAVQASTTLRFSVNDPAPYDVTIPAGTVVSTEGAGDEEPVEFATDEEAVLPADATSVDVDATAVLGGAAGNVTSGTLVEIVDELPGVDAVNNPTDAREGVDAWSDVEYRSAFRAWLAGRGKATPAAIEGRALEVPGVVSAHLRENHPSRGYNKLYVSSGSEGAVSVSLLEAVADALGDEYRGAGTALSVLGADTTSVDVELTLTVRAGYSSSVVQAAVTAAITRYLHALPCAEDVRLARLVQYAMSVPGVQDLEIIDVDGGGAANMTVGEDQVALPGTISFTT